MIDFEAIIRKELKMRNIRVQKWCVEEPPNAYEAYIESRLVRIPKPVDLFTFHVCLHEIGHIVTGDRLYSYLQEYNAEKWAIKRAEYYGIIDESYIRDAKLYVLKYCITDSLVHGLDNIRPYVLEWIGVNESQFSQLVTDNGLKLVMEYINTHVPFKERWELVHDIYIDRNTKTKLSITSKN